MTPRLPTPNPDAARKLRRKLHTTLGSPDGLDYLNYLEQYFEINLPAFQGKLGSYDPLDAMRRDAYREVFLFIRHQLALAKQEQTTIKPI